MVRNVLRMLRVGTRLTQLEVQLFIPEPGFVPGNEPSYEVCHG